jgi:hypothetical protein
MRPLALLALAAALQQGGSITRDPWSGFRPGSWVIIRDKTIADGKTTWAREKITITSIEDGAPLLEARPEKGGGYPPPGQVRRHMRGALVEEMGWNEAEPRAEEFQIGKRKVACKVTEYFVKDSERELESRIWIWRTEEVKVPYRELRRDGPDLSIPSNVVRMEVKARHGPDSQAFDFRIVDLDQKIKVGPRDVPCVLEEGTADERKGTTVRKGTIRRWLSDSVPGRTLRQEIKGEQDGKPVERIEEVLDYDAKK